MTKIPHHCSRRLRTHTVDSDGWKMSENETSRPSGTYARLQLTLKPRVEKDIFFFDFIMVVVFREDALFLTSKIPTPSSSKDQLVTNFSKHPTVENGFYKSCSNYIILYYIITKS